MMIPRNPENKIIYRKESKLLGKIVKNRISKKEVQRKSCITNGI